MKVSKRGDGLCWHSSYRLFPLIAASALCLNFSVSATAQSGSASGGMSAERLKRAAQVQEDYIARGDNAGSVAIVYRKGVVTYAEARGFQDLAKKTPMQRDTIFALASTTKPVTAVAIMILVEEGKLALDQPIDKFLPELANRKVLVDPSGPLTNVQPAQRSITVRDLLENKSGIGWPEPAGIPGDSPIAKAYAIADSGHDDGDALLAKLESLPLVYPPGERFLYNTSYGVLGVLIERVSGMPLGKFFKQRIFDPLKMKDTGFTVPESEKHRVATIYRRPAADGPLLPQTGEGYTPGGDGGLLSTADDFLRFARMLLNKGELDGVRILSRPSVLLMTEDNLSGEPTKSFFISDEFFGAAGFGFGLEVQTKRVQLGPSPGSFWWGGSTGVGWIADPKEDLILIRLVQRLEDYEPFHQDFMTAVYQSIDD